MILPEVLLCMPVCKHKQYTIVRMHLYMVNIIGRIVIPSASIIRSISIFSGICLDAQYAFPRYEYVPQIQMGAA